MDDDAEIEVTPPDTVSHAIEILNEAVAEALRRGHAASGWTVQYDDEAGYAAWVHTDTDTGQTAVLEHVDCYPTFGAAANACLASVSQLGYGPATEAEA